MNITVIDPTFSDARDLPEGATALWFDEGARGHGCMIFSSRAARADFLREALVRVAEQDMAAARGKESRA